MTLKEYLDVLEDAVTAANEGVARASASKLKADRELAALLAIYQPQPDPD